MELWRIQQGDALEVLRTWPSGAAYTCVCSPPYWGLRDYDHPEQLGQEESPFEYAAKLVVIFDEVRRVLRDDGTLWLNLGDSYVTNPPGNARPDHSRGSFTGTRGKQGATAAAAVKRKRRRLPEGFKKKDLVGFPWLVAFALRQEGWFLRSDVIWHKPNAHPESVRDRPTVSHEYFFMFSKSRKYYYDGDSVREPAVGQNHHDLTGGRYAPPGQSAHTGSRNQAEVRPDRNRRTVWSVPTRPYKGTHYAVFPPELIRPCVRASAPEGGLVIDCFAGAGTTGIVAAEEGRVFAGIDLHGGDADLGGHTAHDRIEEARRAHAERP